MLSAKKKPIRAFAASLPMSLLRARESVMQHFRPMLRSFNLTEQQWRILRALSSVDKVEVSELARLTYLLAPSLSRMLKELDKRRLILRSGVDADLRRGAVAISPRGLDLIRRAGIHSETIYADIARRYGVKRLGEMQAMLADLETSMSSTQPTAKAPAKKSIVKRR